MSERVSRRSLTRRAVVAVQLCAAVVIGVGSFAPASAQDFPNKGIKVVVPYGAGGPTDIVARLVAQHMQTAFKQSVIVENRPGAGSIIGARAVATAPADGYTLLLGNISTFAIAPAITKNPGYDPVKAFAPIVQTSDIGMVMVTRPEFPANSVQEFIALAKAQPGKITFASAGVGNSAHLIGELLKARVGIDIVHVPYRSGAESSAAVVGGQTEIGFTDLSASINLIRDGKLKGLAITSLVRTPEFPNMPTMIEVGLPEVELRNWTAIVAPAGTPQPVLTKLTAAVNDALKSELLQTTLKRIGAEATPGTSEALGKLIAADYKRWADVAAKAGISLE